MNQSIKSLVETYNHNMNRIKNFSTDYELCESYDEYIREWNGIKEELLSKRLKMINSILERKIRIMKDSSVLNRMIDEFINIEKDCKFNEKELMKVTYHEDPFIKCQMPLDIVPPDISSPDFIEDTESVVSEDDIVNKMKDSFYTYKEKFSTSKAFDKYINTLPRYYKRSKSKSDDYIKDYLIKNRSARLSDIVRGCKEQGLKTNASDPSSILYKRLNNFIKSGLVTKNGEIYFWNYQDEI